MLATFILNRMQTKPLSDYFADNIVCFERADLYHYISLLRFSTPQEYSKAIRVIYGNHPNVKPKAVIVNMDLQ